MIWNPIENSLTRQGGVRDVSSYFTINTLVTQSFSPDQMRAVTSSSWLCQKVVGIIPKEMVNVQFSVTLGGQAGKVRSIQDLTMIQDQLRRLMPWFGEAQKKANIIGKSYLILQARGFKHQEQRETPEEILENEEVADTDPPKQQQPQKRNYESYLPDTDFTGESIKRHYYNTFRNRNRNRNKFLEHATLDLDGEVGLEGVSIDNLMQRFPYTFAIDWDNFGDMQIAGVEIVDGDVYKMSSDGRFLYRNWSLGQHSAPQQQEINIKKTLTKWYNDDPYGNSNELDIIHKSHVIEFTAFDYQEQKQDRPNRHGIDGHSLSGNTTVAHPSYRLTRFVSALLYYDSFVNSVLNRTHRSEFIAYKKPNLGDTNLELARLSAAADFSHPAIPAPVLDPTTAIETELQTIANSALNLGVVLVDKDCDLTMIARSFTGIQNVHDVFRPIVIGASGLTEFTLMGLTMAAAGLNSHDVRDRMAIASQVDALFRDTWQPILEQLANKIATSYPSFPTYSYLSIKPESSFKLTELEIADVLDKLVATRLALVEKGIISREELRAELKGDGLIGKYFIITEPDRSTQKEIALNLSLLQRNTQNSPTRVNLKVNTQGRSLES